MACSRSTITSRPWPLQALDRLPGHEEIFFGGGFERFLDVEQTRFDHHHGCRHAPLVTQHKLHVGPVLDFCAPAARAPEQSQLHRVRLGVVERGGQIAHKLVGPSETDLGVVHSKRSHALQQQHRVGHGDFEVRLLQAVTQAGVEQLDFSWVVCGHVSRESLALPMVFCRCSRNPFHFIIS